jgi:hypothetical protein
MCRCTRYKGLDRVSRLSADNRGRQIYSQIGDFAPFLLGRPAGVVGGSRTAPPIPVRIKLKSFYQLEQCVRAQNHESELQSSSWVWWAATPPHPSPKRLIVLADRRGRFSKTPDRGPTNSVAVSGHQWTMIRPLHHQARRSVPAHPSVKGAVDPELLGAVVTSS